MPERSSLTLGELIDVVVDHHLVDYCYISRDDIRVSIRGTVLSFSSQDARSFLALLLAGWKRTPASVQTYLSAASTSSAPSVTPSRRAGEIPEGDGSGAVEEYESSWPSGYTNYLNIFLAMAEELELIAGFTKHPQRTAITILTQATKVEMSYIDAFEYLSSIIAQELRRRVAS